MVDGDYRTQRIENSGVHESISLKLGPWDLILASILINEGQSCLSLEAKVGRVENELVSDFSDIH